MKNLRKVLSLALAIALSLSLAVVAGAKNVGDYPDKDSVNPDYLEAVDVLTALGVFEGNDDGSLDPQGTFTRAQAAKILTYISIGTTAANRLSHRASSFTDVPTDHWANPFIEYAVEKGIINGVGGGKFEPNAAVTGAQASKMLLVALGYGVKGEYVGPSWELKAIVDGQARGILTADADYSAPAKREEVAQYTFNTIRPEGENNAGLQRNFLVKYTDLIGDYIKVNSNLLESGTSDFLGYEVFGLINHYEADALEYGGHTWRLESNRGFDITGFYRTDRVIGTSMAGTPITNITNKYHSAFIAELNDNVEFYVNGVWRAAREYYSDGTPHSEYTSGFFDTAELNTWLNGSEPVIVQGDSTMYYPVGQTTSTQDPTKAYYTGMIAAGAYVTIQNKLYKTQVAIGTAPFSVTQVGDYTSGAIVPDTASLFTFIRDFTLPAAGVPRPIYNGAGVIIDLIDTGAGAGGYDGKADKVIVIDKEVHTVAALPSLNAMTNQVSFPGVITSPLHKDLIDYPADIVVKDVVLTYQDNEGVLHIEKANTVTGKLERVSTPIMITVDGAMYLPSGLVGRTNIFDAGNGYVTGDRLSANLNKLATLWLDNGGNVVAIASAEAIEYNQYGLVIGYEYTGSTVTGGSAKARLVLQDGTIKVFDVAPNAQGVVPNQGTVGTNADSTILNNKTATLVKYNVDNNGAITLLPYGTAIATSTPIHTGTVATYAKGSSVVQIGTSSHYITSSTKVFYFNDSAAYQPDSTIPTTYNRPGVVTGYTRTVAAVNVTVYYAVATNTTQLEAIFFAQNSAGLGASDNYIFFLSASPSAGKDTSGNIDVNYYTGYSTANDTAPITISSRLSNTAVSAAIDAPGLYRYELDADGFVLGATYIKDYNTNSVLEPNQVITIVNPDETGTSGYIGYGLPSGGGGTDGVIYDSNTKFYIVKYPDFVVDIFGSYNTATVPPQSQLKSGAILATAGEGSFDSIVRIQGIQPGKTADDPAAAIYFSMD
jgi:hypothetical protein